MLPNMINLSNFEILDMKESEYNYRFLIKSNTSPPLKLAGILVLLVYHQLLDHFQRYGLFHMLLNGSTLPYTILVVG